MDSFSEHGNTYRIEKAPALWYSSSPEEKQKRDFLSKEQYYSGRHVDPGTSRKPRWSDPKRGKTTCDAIRLQVSTKCWEFQSRLGLPRGQLLKKTDRSVTLLLSLDDLIAFQAGTNYLWHNYKSKSKDRQATWNGAGYNLYWRVCRIVTAWIDHIKSLDRDKEQSTFYLPFNYPKEKAAAASKYPKQTKALSLQHAADLQAGIRAKVKITEWMASLLHELGVSPEIPHPDAPEWDYGDFEVTPTTLDDLEQRCVKIINPVFLKNWKEAKAKENIIHISSGEQFGAKGIVASKAPGIGQGLYNRIAKARAILEEKARNAGR